MPLRRAILIVLMLLASVRAASEDDAIPKRWLDPLLPEALPPVVIPAYAKPIDRARAEMFGGRYKRSLMTLLAAKDADAVEIALVRSQSLTALGRAQEALAALAEAKVASNFRARLQSARILVEFDRAAEALPLLKALVAEDANSIAARFELAHAEESIGDLKSALTDYGWFVQGDDAPFARFVRDPDTAFESAEEIVLIGRATDRWASLGNAYQDHDDLHDAILNTFVHAYDVIDREYWPAHVAAAKFYLAHDDSQNAMVELKLAAKGNPNDLELLILAGRMALSGFSFDRCDAAIAAIRKIDPASSAADILEARNFLAQRQPALAIAPLQRVLAARSRDVEALGVLASAYALQLKDDQTADVLKQVDAIDVDHDDATARNEVAQQLGAMRQYPRAAAMYQAAIERAPWWIEPRNGLGLLYTQSGDEADAQTVLAEAHQRDPFNLRTTNYLRLLDDLNAFARSESAHFIVMYDKSSDPVIPQYFGDYLESVYADVTREYAAEPPAKTMIEVFPTHDAFSVRTTGSPWIGTVGASTGRVIALVAPRAGENTMGPFDWSQVLRHEFTHTVTLAATDNRIPHWMTEGLAVFQEHTPLRWEWVPMLYHAVNENKLFPLDQLTWSFIRPRKPIDRQLAYAESFWICTFIEKNFGHESILKMLDAYKHGQSQCEAFTSVLGESEDVFSRSFFAWTREQVSGWGYDTASAKKYDALRESGEALIAADQNEAAIKVWQQIAALRPVDALPHQRLAGLYLSSAINDKLRAIAQLKALEAVELKDNRFAKRIAAIEIELGKTEDARTDAMRAVYIDPYDPAAHELLLNIAQTQNDAKTIAREEQVLELLKTHRSSTDEHG